MAKRKPTPGDFGYKSLTLKASTVKKMAQEYNRFQEASGKPLLNFPVMSEFLDLALTLTVTPPHRLPRLILVSKSRHRTVLFDAKVWRPVVLEVDRKGDLSCTRVRDLELYKSFSRRANPVMFKKVRDA